MKLFFPMTIVFAIVIAGCTHPTNSRVRSDATTYSSVAVALPQFKPKRGQSFAWYGDPIWTDSQMAASYSFINNHLTHAINSELLKRGYRIVDEQSQADFVIGLAVITENGERSSDMNQFFRLFPGLPKSAAGFDKGVIVAAVIDTDQVKPAGETPQREAVLWRSALEAFILGEKIDSVQRQARIETLSGILMKRFP